MPPDEPANVFVQLPSYFPQIVGRLAAADWIVHNFPLRTQTDLFNPANFVHNVELHGFRYNAFVDANVFQFIVHCLKREAVHDKYRTAAALIAFCQIAGIELDPTYALYERINYDAEFLEEALDDLELFRRLDNSLTDDMAFYALGESDVVQAAANIDIDRDQLRIDLVRYRRLREWDSMYLMVLAMIHTRFHPAIAPVDRLSSFIDWLITRFRLSLPAIAYASRLFGASPMARMMKYRPDQSQHSKRSAAFNMTWDLFLMNAFFCKWTSTPTTEQHLLVTDDRVFKEVLRAAIRAQSNSDLNALVAGVEGTSWSQARELLETYESRSDRAYLGDGWHHDYRAALISELEGKIFS